MQVKDKKTIKRDILAQFRSLDEEAPMVLSLYGLQQTCLERDDTREKKKFEKAVSELVSQGLFVRREKPVVKLSLTEKGASLIRP